jgi:hypothetical protein
MLRDINEDLKKKILALSPGTLVIRRLTLLTNLPVSELSKPGVGAIERSRNFELLYSKWPLLISSFFDLLSEKNLTLRRCDARWHFTILKCDWSDE